MGSNGSGSDLLIFSERGYASPNSAVSKKQAAEKQKPTERFTVVQEKIQSQEDVKKLYCINHPWRHAYAICDRCKLPYCYVDLIAFKKRFYCLQDIDFAARQKIETAEGTFSPNNFSIIASGMFLANSILLIYSTYHQMEFLFSSTFSAGLSGMLQFFLNLNPQYYLPFANTLIIIFGFVSATAILRKSPASFGFGFIFAFISLLIVAYEYLNSSVTYLLVSSLLMLITISFATFSRMSSESQLAEESYNMVPSVEWPKPEVF